MKNLLVNFNFTRLGRGLALMIISLILWNISFTKEYILKSDYFLANLINPTLKHIYIAKFWAIFNKKFEIYLNAIIILGLNLYYIYISPKSNKITAISNVLLLWGYMEICVNVVNYIFFDLLEVRRNSPSIEITYYIKLSEVFNDIKIKDSSTKSFPSGHAFAMFYWLFFSAKFMPKKLIFLGFFVAVFFSLPRLFSGAHWLSDLVFAIFVADFCVNILISTPLYERAIFFIGKLLLWLRKLYSK